MVRAVGAALAAAIAILTRPSHLGGGLSSGTLRGAEGFDGFDLATWGDSLSWGSEGFWPVEPEDNVIWEGASKAKGTFGPTASEGLPDAHATNGPVKG
jgi:hypothetical protein